jgi:hypothetical protein
MVESMHLIVPFAGVLSEAGRHAAQTLSLPHLQRLLSRAQAGEVLGSDEHSLSAPHELALAQALGWPLADGLLPWAARAARRDGVELGTQPVGQLTPVHLHLGTEQVTLTDPDALAVAPDDARTLFDALRSLFTEDGFQLHWGTTQRWYVAHESLGPWPTASLDRVIGRNVDPWLPDAPGARRWRRLQSEAQMLLHAHAVNERRETQDLAAVNSLWLSGCGVSPAATSAAALEPTLDQRLRSAALAEDWAAWAEAWHALDAGPLALLLDAPDGASFTLAGERHAQRFTLNRRSTGQRLKALWQKPSVQSVLEAL